MTEKQILHPHYIVDYDDAQGVEAEQSAADVAVFSIPPEGCTVLYAALIITETCAGSTPGVVKFDHRPTAGADTDRTDGDIATFALATTAAGKVLYDRAAEGTELNGGEEVVVQLSTAAAGTPAGHFRPVLAILPNEDLVWQTTNAVATA